LRATDGDDYDSRKHRRKESPVMAKMMKYRKKERKEMNGALT